MVCAMMAPTLPEAAERPCEVDLYRVGKHSPGTMKVVALGPVEISCRAKEDWIYRSKNGNEEDNYSLTKVEKELS